MSNRVSAAVSVVNTGAFSISVGGGASEGTLFLIQARLNRHRQLHNCSKECVSMCF